VSEGWVPLGMTSGPGPGTPTAGPGVKGEKGEWTEGRVWVGLDEGKKNERGEGKEEEEEGM
jgi:hypothetical protein